MPRTPIDPSLRSAPLRAVAFAIAASACGGRGCGDRAPAPTPAAVAPSATARAAPIRPAVVVPRAGAALAIDGKNEEPAWMGSGRTGPFVDAAGVIGRPYSDARLLWDDRNLYLTLYAADHDIEARSKEHDGPLADDDSFTVRLAPLGAGAPEAGAAAFLLVAAPNGAIADAREAPGGARDPGWESHAVVAVDADGTVNRPEDEDEEWIVEIALPWASLGVTPSPGLRLSARFGRCDVPRGSARRCSVWGEASAGEIVLGPEVSTPPPAPATPPARPRARVGPAK